MNKIGVGGEDLHKAFGLKTTQEINICDQISLLVELIIDSQQQQEQPQNEIEGQVEEDITTKEKTDLQVAISSHIFTRIILFIIDYYQPTSTDTTTTTTDDDNETDKAKPPQATSDAKPNIEKKLALSSFVNKITTILPSYDRGAFSKCLSELICVCQDIASDKNDDQHSNMILRGLFRIMKNIGSNKGIVLPFRNHNDLHAVLSESLEEMKREMKVSVEALHDFEYIWESFSDQNIESFSSSDACKRSTWMLISTVHLDRKMSETMGWNINQSADIRRQRIVLSAAAIMFGMKCRVIDEIEIISKAANAVNAYSSKISRGDETSVHTITIEEIRKEYSIVEQKYYSFKIHQDIPIELKLQGPQRSYPKIDEDDDEPTKHDYVCNAMSKGLRNVHQRMMKKNSEHKDIDCTTTLLRYKYVNEQSLFQHERRAINDIIIPCVRQGESTSSAPTFPVANVFMYESLNLKENMIISSSRYRLPTSQDQEQVMSMDRWTTTLLGDSAKSIGPSTCLFQVFYLGDKALNQTSTSATPENVERKSWKQVIPPILNDVYSVVSGVDMVVGEGGTLAPASDLSSTPPTATANAPTATGIAPTSTVPIRKLSRTDLARSLVVLYYQALEAMLRYEYGRMRATNHAKISKLINNQGFHRALLSICYVCIVHATGMSAFDNIRTGTYSHDHGLPFNLPTILKRMKSTAYEYLKVSEAFIRCMVDWRIKKFVPGDSDDDDEDKKEGAAPTKVYATDGDIPVVLVAACPLEMKNSLRSIEDKIMDSFMWTQKRKLTTCGEYYGVTLIEALESIKAAANHENPGCFHWPVATLELDNPVKRLNTPNQRSRDIFERPDSNCPHKDLFPELIFLQYLMKRFQRMALKRICDLTKAFDIRAITPQIWFIFHTVLKTNINLFYDRHIDQMILCTVYGVSKVVDFPEKGKSFARMFEELTKYNKERFGDELGQMMTDSLKSISLDDEKHMGANRSAGYGSIVHFFNNVYVPSMKEYLLHNDALKEAKEQIKKQRNELMSSSQSPSIDTTSEAAKLPPTSAAGENVETSQSDVLAMSDDNDNIVADPVCVDDNSTRIQITGRNIQVKIPQSHAPVPPTRVIHNFGDSYGIYR